MSIPLDKLYHYVHDLCKEVYGNVSLYRFYPHGSKNIRDLSMLFWPRENHYIWLNLWPEVFCNDQEPLNYEMYENIDETQQSYTNYKWASLIKQKNLKIDTFNFRGSIRNIWDKALLLHSELNSQQVSKYKNCQFIPVYYWSHAVIARDWFRYAQHVNQQKRVEKTFLCYNRAWCGTREYRLKFLDLLIKNNLIDSCVTTVNPIEPELNTHYNDHSFDNPIWRPCHVLENHITTSTAHSYYSADFDIADYESTDVEIVLETLFDDSRWHLTEKTLRPIALGQPFVLASTAGSLKYLQSYGFKTFHEIWDESYDLELDPMLRLEKIVDLIKHIQQWDSHTREKKLKQAEQITQHNKNLFFSDKFFYNIKQELATNLKTAFTELENNNTASLWFERRRLNYNDPELLQVLRQLRSEKDADLVLEQALKYRERNSSHT